MECHHLNCAEDRLHSRDAAPVGAFLGVPSAPLSLVVMGPRTRAAIVLPNLNHRGGRFMSTAKEELKALLDAQPEDSSSEELVRELALHVMVQRGLADSDAGRSVTNDEMARRIRTWQKQLRRKRRHVGLKTSLGTWREKIRGRRPESYLGSTSALRC